MVHSLPERIESLPTNPNESVNETLTTHESLVESGSGLIKIKGPKLVTQSLDIS
jgi:hypothetical protein